MAVCLVKGWKSTIKGLRNASAPVPGTTVTAYFGVWDSSPNVWIYSLWEGEGDDETLIANGEFDLSGLPVTVEQAARIAFVLECEYAD